MKVKELRRAVPSPLSSLSVLMVSSVVDDSLRRDAVPLRHDGRTRVHERFTPRVSIITDLGSFNRTRLAAPEPGMPSGTRDHGKQRAASESLRSSAGRRDHARNPKRHFVEPRAAVALLELDDSVKRDDAPRDLTGHRQETTVKAERLKRVPRFDGQTPSNS